MSVNGNGVAAPAMTEDWRIDRVSGDVVFRHDGRDFRLRPTMEATIELEDLLGMGADMLRTRAAVSGLAGQDIGTELSLKTRELGAILYVGIKAAGGKDAAGVNVEAATKVAWQIGRQKLRKPLFEFLWACADGGRLREDDLKNAVSPNGSGAEPNGAEGTDTTRDLTAELTAGLHSEGS